MTTTITKLHPVDLPAEAAPVSIPRLEPPRSAPRPGFWRPRPLWWTGWVRGRRGFAILGSAALGVVLVAVVAARMGGGAAKTAGATAPAQTITAATVQSGAIKRLLVVTGSLAAWDELPIGAEAGGLAIVEVDAEQGDHVRKGQLLARLDDSVLRAQLAQADAAIAQAEAGVLKSQAVAATAASDVRRAAELMKNGYISAQAAEQRATTLATAQADVNVARQALATAKALRDERAAQLAQTEIRAPTDGIVSKRSATLGNVVAVGEQLFRMIRDGRVELRAEVPETDLERLSAGQVATIALDGDSGRRFEGHIRLMGATVDPQTRIGVVYIALPEDPLLKPGMFVRGSILTGTGETLLIPESAIVFKDGKPTVFVIGGDDHTRLQRVDTGARQEGMVEILHGLAAGDRVAVAGAGYLKDNDLVRVETALPQSGIVR